MKLKDPAHLDGIFEGQVYSINDFSIGENGIMEGFLRARHVIVSGKFTGQIDCDVLEIIQKGEVKGDIHAREICVETGSRFTGKSYVYDDFEFHDKLPSNVQADLNLFRTNSSDGKIITVDLFQESKQVN